MTSSARLRRPQPSLAAELRAVLEEIAALPEGEAAALAEAVPLDKMAEQLAALLHLRLGQPAGRVILSLPGPAGRRGDRPPSLQMELVPGDQPAPGAAPAQSGEGPAREAPMAPEPLCLLLQEQPEKTARPLRYRCHVVLQKEEGRIVEVHQKETDGRRQTLPFVRGPGGLRYDGHPNVAEISSAHRAAVHWMHKKGQKGQR